MNTSVQSGPEEILGASRLRVTLNGVDFSLPDRDSIALLLSLLKQYTLDPTFEDYGDFMVPCHEAARGELDPDTCEREYVDLGPIYKDAPNAVRFIGNFLEVWHPFNIDTDDPQIIEMLREAIRKNQESPNYLSARSDWMNSAPETRQ